MISQIELQSQFTKPEILKIAEELEIDVNPSLGTARILEIVIRDIEANGVPELDDCSDLLGEFLVTAEYIDETGALISKQDTSEVEEEADEVEIDESRLPPCFSKADPRDPACMRCAVFDACMVSRIANRPPCFGTFLATDDQCRICLEAADCKIIKDGG